MGRFEELTDPKKQLYITWPILIGLFLALIVPFAFMVAAPFFMSPPKRRGEGYDPKGKHVYITGGSQGTGLALAKLLASKGANVTIVARTVSKLEAAVKEIEAARADVAQKVIFISADLGDEKACVEALVEAERRMGSSVQYVFMVAGSSRPAMFSQTTTAAIAHEMRTDYLTAAFTAHAAVQSFLNRNENPHMCRLVFVSSLVGLMGLPGYSSYSAAKFALRGLAECLRQEMLMYGVKVHVFYPGTIFSPGYEEEQKVKPNLTKSIEEGDGGVTCEKAAEILVRGIKKEKFGITCDFKGELIRSINNGIPPTNSFFGDRVLAAIAWIALPIWRKGVDNNIVSLGWKTRRGVHEGYMAAKEAALEAESASPGGPSESAKDK